uniref:IPT/TIG domain-containing protein n=1 Tax=Callorhinchus milii TaxID=7868 RepID=A0A4W3GUN5_CALMI
SPPRRSEQQLVCVTGVSVSGTGRAVLTVSIDRADLANLDHNFLYVEDPRVFLVEPNWTIVNGSTRLTVTGTGFSTIQKPRVRAQYRGLESSNVSITTTTTTPTATTTPPPPTTTTTTTTTTRTTTITTTATAATTQQ